MRVTRALGLDANSYDACARIRDIGMIGLPDRIVLATEPLGAADWQFLNRHPG